jgi:hypothetical protein
MHLTDDSREIIADHQLIQGDILSPEHDAEVVEVAIGTEAEKAKLLDQLVEARAVKDRVALFAKVMDTYGLDAIISLFPTLGDSAVGTVSTLYLLYEGRKLGFSWKESLQIIGYQTVDRAVGNVPVIGDIADFFFKANRSAYKIFEEKVALLEQYARDHGVTQLEIDALTTQRQTLVDMIRDSFRQKKG